MSDGSPRRDPASVLAQLWQSGQKPDVGEVLRQAQNPTRAQIVAALAFDQWQRWHTGERVPAEAHLKMHPSLQDAEEGFDLVFGEFLLREELGEHP
ncbi:MAG: hypothetical protein AB7K24_34570, partial [Gemmataceae bacterium]